MVTKKNMSAASYRGVPHDTRLVYATYAAMKAATGLVSGQVGHIGKITADNSYWILEQVSPCVRWALFSGESISRGDETIYVDWDNGSDTTGNGASGFPYKSHRFMGKRSFPKKVKDHTINIDTTASNSYDYWPADGMPDTEGTGRVIFDGSTETFPVYKGTFTVTGVAYDAGGAAHYGVSHATYITVAAAGWTVDEFYGKFIRMTSGNWEDYILYIDSNTADTITTISDWYTFQVGDEFEIVTEPIKITVDHPVMFNGPSKLRKYNSETTPDTPFEPGILMCGYRFTSSSFNPFRLENINIYMSACTFWGTNASSSSANIVSSYASINYDDVPSGSFSVPELEDFYALATQSIPNNGNPVFSSILTCLLVQGSTTLGQMTMRGEMRFESAPSWSACFGVQCGKVSHVYSQVLTLEYMFIHQKGFDTPSMVSDGCSQLVVVSAYCKHHEGVLSMRGGDAALTWLKSEDSIAAYAADLGAGCFVRVLDSSNVTAQGTTGAVLMKFPTAAPGPYTWASWPAANVIQTNLAGTYCTGDNT